MIGHGAKFGRKKEQAIVALLTQRTIEEAARAVGIGTATLLRWLKDPEFDAEYRAARRTAFSQAITRLQQASGAAATTLLKIMVDPNAPVSIRARVADNVLDHAGRGIALEDSAVRLAALEEATQQKKSSGDEGNQQTASQA